jgi:hypothetical protein
MHWSLLVLFYIIGMAVVSYILGKYKFGDATPLVVSFWPLFFVAVIIAYPFMWIYAQGKKNS